MQFVMKHFSKKVLSVILALMILISAVSVAFSAIVTAQSAPYLVTEGKPAIPAMQGSLIDLSKIEVQFGDNIYSGAALEWAAVDTMGGSVSNTAKTILYATSKPFAVTATHTESGKSKTIYVLQPDTTTGEVVLYDHIFTTDDLTTGSDGYKVFKESSEWTYWSNATTDKLRFDIYSYNGGLCTLNDIAGQQVIYYLKPDSDAGRLVSNFPDLTIETVSASRGLEGTSGPFFRLNIGNDGLTTPRDESFVFAGIIRRSSTTSNPVVQVYTENGQINDNNSYPYYYQGGTAVRLYIAAKAYPVELFLTTRATIEGKNLTINYKTSSDKACTTNVIEALPVRINLSSKELSTTGGTIGAGAYGYQPDSRNIGLHSFKALITFSASELAKMDDFSTTEGIVIVSAGKPAVAMLSGKTLDLNKIVVTYNDGSVVTGNEINWSINDKAVILDSNNALTVYKAGTYELIATKKSDGNAKKTIYIFAVDSKKYAINLYEYTFKQSDKGTVGTDGTYSFGSSAEEKPWKIYAAAGTSVVWDAGGDPDGLGSASGITSRVNLGLNTGTATSTLMLNPNSAEGKLVSNFADYTIVYRSTTHPNFVSWNSVSASVAARYVMTGTTPVRANDRYLGTTFYWSNAYIGSMLYNDAGTAKSHKGNAVVNSGFQVVNNQTVDGDIDLKMQFAGEDFIVSAKGAKSADSAYVKLYQMSADATAPAAAKASTQAGTFVAFSNSDNRLTSQYFKAYIEFTDADYTNIEKAYIENDNYVVTANKPAIPLNVNKTVKLDNIVVEFDDGEFKLGTDIAWESLSGTMAYDNATNSLSVYREGNYVLKAKKSATDTEGKEINIFVVAAGASLEQITAYEYAFKESDAGIADENGVYAFGSDAAEKPWKFYTTAGTKVQWSPGGHSSQSGGVSNVDIGGTKYNVLSGTVNNGINIGSKTGYLVLNPASKEGKMLSSFSDYTIIYRASLHPNFVAWNSRCMLIMGRYQISDTATGVPSYSSDKYLGYRVYWSNSSVGTVAYQSSGLKYHAGNSVANSGYEFEDVAINPYNKRVLDGNLDIKLDYKGEDFTVSVKSHKKDDSAYLTLYKMSTDDTAPAAAKATANQKGTFVAYTDSESNASAQAFKVIIDFEADKLSKLVVSDAESLYNLTQDTPAIPMKKGYKLNLSELLVELPNGDFVIGHNLNWECDYIGSNFFVDNTEKAVYAYGEGRYNVTVKNPDDNNNVVMTVYFLVSEDGEYKLLDHTFTKADLEAMAETGKSDKWMVSVHDSSDNPGLNGINGTNFMPYRWINKLLPLTINKEKATENNAFYDANKGISFYSNNISLVLNPESEDAKVISKFSDYNINFTSTARDKQTNGAVWKPTGSETDKGAVGAIGRIDFGEDNKFSLSTGLYLTHKNIYNSAPYNVTSGKIVSILPGTVINFSDIRVEKNGEDFITGENYTWENINDATRLVIDSANKTITATEPGTFNVKVFKNGTELMTVSFVVSFEPLMDHVFMGSFNVKNSPTVDIVTTRGYSSNSYLYYSHFDRSLSVSNFKYESPYTYNYRVTLKGANMAFYVAPNGTSNYTEIYDTAKDTTLEAKHTDSLATSNVKTGTIALYSSKTASAWFKSVSVSLDFDSIPKQTALGDCYDDENRYIYLQVGQKFILPTANFEAGTRYHNGANITFSNSPTGLTIVTGQYIQADIEGVYTLNAVGNDGTEFTITVVVSAIGAIFNNDNYTFTYEEGVIKGYPRADVNKPYSEYVFFPSEIDGHFIYDIGNALAVGNLNNSYLVRVEFDKFIEKIGSGAFIGATKLKEIILPNTVEEIGNSAFAGATSLEDLFLPGSVSVIGDYAFQNCGAVNVIISNPNAEIGTDAFTDGAVIYGFAGSTAKAYADANGLTFIELTGSDKAKAEDSYNEWVEFEATRYTKVNETVEWTYGAVLRGGKQVYYLKSFTFTDRTAGKFVLPATAEITINGKKETRSVYAGASVMGNKYYSRSVYAVELAEGITEMGYYAFQNCYNLRDVKLPESLAGISYLSFEKCTSLERIEIPRSLLYIGPEAFNHCTNLKEIVIPADSRLQTIGQHGPTADTSQYSFLLNTKVEKLVLPVTVDLITKNIVTQPTSYGTKVNEIWVYNKDARFPESTVADQPYLFNKNTIIHGVPGSTAEALVRADEALKNDPDPNKRQYYRGYTFVGDIEDFTVTNENVVDTNGKFTAKYYDSEVVSETTTKTIDPAYYTITGFVGMGGKVTIPSSIDVGNVKNAPIYAISSRSFQNSNGVPTNGIGRIITLELEEGIAVIEKEAFSGLKNLKNVKLPSTLRVIGEKAFYQSGVTGKVEIPKNVTEIGKNAFRNSTKLTDVVITNPNTKIGANAFDATVTIHGIKGSTAETFATTNKLNFVAIDAPAATTLADITDNKNYKLTVTDGYVTGYERLDATKPFSLKVTIPATIDGVAIKGVAEGTFEAGAEATSVYAVELAEGITEISKNAFKNLTKLSYFNIPKSLKTIGESAFEGTLLAGELTLPETLEKVEKNAFKNLNGIHAITILNKNIVLEGTSLPRGNTDLVVYGYTGSTAETWATNFKVKFEYLDGGPAKEPIEDDEEPDYTEEPTEEPEEDEDEDDESGGITTIIRQSNLTIVIIIALGMLLLAIILAAAVVIIVVVKANQDDDE